MISNICNNPDILYFTVVIKNIINIIQIAVPSLLIIFSSIDILKAVIAADDKQISKKLSLIPKRLVIMAIIFLIPFFIDFTMEIAADDFEYAACYENATMKNVEELYKEQAYKAVTLAEKTASLSDYYDAKRAVNKVSDEEIREILTARLEAVRVVIEARIAEEKAAREAERKSKYSNEVVSIALAHLGTEYVWGGESWQGGLDCSGFVYRVYNDAGYKIPRLTANGYKTVGCTVSSIAEAQPGDLLIYGSRHIAIYMGPDQNGTKWRIHSSGSRSCNGKTSTGCQVKKDTDIYALFGSEKLTIKRIMGECSK